MKTETIVPVLPSSTRIPRIIHQTYPSKTLPEALARNVGQLKQDNPDWVHNLYDDHDIERFILDNYGHEILARYHRIEPTYGAARADLFRYLAVYKLGGVYLDIKSRFMRPLSSILSLDEHYIISHWDNGAGGAHENWGFHPELAGLPRGEIQQWHIIAAPGHPFLRAVIARVLANIDSYRPWRDRVGKTGVLRLSGPVAYTLAISPLLDRYPHTVIEDHRSIGLQYSIVAGHEHRGLFRRHYSQNNTPVVRLPIPARWIASVYLGARGLARWVLLSSDAQIRR